MKFLKEAKNLEKLPKMIILRPEIVIFERFSPPSKFHFPACSTLYIINIFWFLCHNHGSRNISVKINCIINYKHTNNK